MKTNSFFTKVSMVSAIVAIAIMMGMLAGCQQEDKPIIYKDKITDLAQKYGMNISFAGESQNAIELSSLEELESVFKQIAEKRAMDTTKEIFLDSSDNGSVTSKTKEEGVSLVLPKLKNGGEIYNSSNWFYDLTWYNVVIVYSGNPWNIQISSYYSGYSAYSYTQNASTVTSVNNGIISYKIVGLESMTYTILGVTFTESRTIQATGIYNPSTGLGSISLAGNGYWFQ